MKSNINSDASLVIPAFWVGNQSIPTEIPIDSPAGRIFKKEYIGNETHFGWMDLVQLKDLLTKKHASHIILKNMDTLGRIGKMLGKIFICTVYQYNRYIITSKIPPEGLNYCRALYNQQHIFYPWDFDENTSERLPSECKRYMLYILTATNVMDVTYTAKKFSVTVYWDEKHIPRFRETRLN